MKRTWDESTPIPQLETLSLEHQQLVREGFEVIDGRVYLRANAGYRQTLPPGDAWANEGWVNDVHLESTLPADSPKWRGEVIAQGLAIANALLPAAHALGDGCAAQAIISVQSSPDEQLHPNQDHATGNLKIVLLRDERDDPRTYSGDMTQPLLVLTVPNTSRLDR